MAGRDSGAIDSAPHDNLKAIPFWIQTGAITDHYAFLFQRTDFLTWIKNSLIISVVATGVSLAIAILAGYSLARLRYRGVSSFGTAVFVTYLVPPTLLFLPLSQVVVWLGISDSIWALIVSSSTHSPSCRRPPARPRSSASPRT